MNHKPCLFPASEGIHYSFDNCLLFIVFFITAVNNFSRSITGIKNLYLPLVNLKKNKKSIKSDIHQIKSGFSVLEVIELTM